MRKLLFVLSMLAMLPVLQSQSAAFTGLKKVLHEKFPELQLDNRIVAVNFRSSAEPSDGEIHNAFAKTFEIYSVAKLKGGPEGMIYITIHPDNEISAAGDNAEANKYLSLKASDLTTKFPAVFKNGIYDMHGRELNRNLAASEIRPAVQKLITR